LLTIGMTVSTATRQVTTFGVSAATSLNVGPDQAKDGADFMHISESPAAGRGDHHAGIPLERMLISDVPLTADTSPGHRQLGGQWRRDAAAATGRHPGQRHPDRHLKRILFNLIQIEQDPRQASRWSCYVLRSIR